MARKRYVGVQGALGASLTSSATSVTFAAALTYAGGTNVPTLASGDIMALSILDSTGVVSEIVWLTAYTSGATTGTIARGKEGTTGVSHASGDKFEHAPTRWDIAPSFEDALSMVESATMVHRWKFDIASGTTINDLVGSLNLTLSGTTPDAYSVAGPQGNGIDFAAGTYAVTSGLGSIPVAGAARTILVIYTNPPADPMCLISYGTNSSLQWFTFWSNYNTSKDTQMFLSTWGGTDLGLPGFAMGDQPHLGAVVYDGNRTCGVYVDGDGGTFKSSGALNTSTANNFQVGRRVADSSGSEQFTGVMYEVIVFNDNLSKYELDQLYTALRRT